jgi:hypothetical protein
MRYFEKNAERSKKQDVVRGIVGGAAAGAAASVLTHPIDTLMVTKQTKPESYAKLMKELKNPELGVLGKTKRLYSGIGFKTLKNALAIGTILGINQLINQK